MKSESIGKRLLDLRKENNLTQAELANKLGVTHQSISEWEEGQHLPDTGTLLQISKIYGVTIECNHEGTEHERNKKQLENGAKRDLKVSGLNFNILAALLLIPVSLAIIILKFNELNEVFLGDEPENITSGLLSFLFVFILGLCVLELLHYFIYKFMGFKKVTIRIKDHMFFLYSPETITVKQARTYCIVPYLFFLVMTIISLIFLNVFFCFAIAFMLVVASDSLFMYFRLRKEDPNAKLVQAKDFYGYYFIE